MESQLTTHQQAVLLVASVRCALINGCRHYDKAGNLLGTERAVLETLGKEGRVTIDASDRVERTTDGEQLALMMEV